VSLLTPNCAKAAREGRPNRDHHCTGGFCDCTCHHRRAAPWFRQQVEDQRAQRRAQTPGPGERGEAPPGPGTGGAG
jgi:hypothetical protein